MSMSMSMSIVTSNVTSIYVLVHASLSAALNESISSQSKFLEDFLENSDKIDFTRKVAFLPLVNQVCLAKIAMSTFFLQKLNLNSRQTLHSPSTEFCSIFFIKNFII